MKTNWKPLLALVLCLLLGTVFLLPAAAKEKGPTETRFETVSFVVTDDKAKNMATIGKYVAEAGANDVDLILFPELSTCGLPEDISMNTVSEEAKVYFAENAEYVPVGPTVKQMTEWARQYDMSIAWTMLEKDPYYPDRLYNTQVLVGPEGFVGKYHKVHLAGTEAYMEEAGTAYSEVFDTRLGKIGMVTCFDKVSPDTVRELKLRGAEIVLAPSAWPGLDQRLGDLDPIMQLYRYTGTSRTMENGVIFLETNWAANPGDKTNAEAGHARICDARGMSYGETGWTEGIVVADIDVKASLADYYKHLDLTEEEHLDHLQQKQDKHKKNSDTAGVALTNVKFYGSALLNTLLDADEAVLFKHILTK